MSNSIICDFSGETQDASVRIMAMLKSILRGNEKILKYQKVTLGKLHSNLEWAMSNADSSSIADNNDAYSSCVEFNDYVRNLFLGFKFTELETADELLRNADHYNTLVKFIKEEIKSVKCSISSPQKVANHVLSILFDDRITDNYTFSGTTRKAALKDSKVFKAYTMAMKDFGWDMTEIVAQIQSFFKNKTDQLTRTRAAAMRKGV